MNELTSKPSLLIKSSLWLTCTMLFAWVIYIFFLLVTRIDKQSVYVGSVTLWTAVLLIFYFFAIGVNAIVLLITWKRQISGFKKATRFFFGSVLVALVLFYASIQIIDYRMIA